MPPRSKPAPVPVATVTEYKKSLTQPEIQIDAGELAPLLNQTQQFIGQTLTQLLLLVVQIKDKDI